MDPFLVNVGEASEVGSVWFAASQDPNFQEIVRGRRFAFGVECYPRCNQLGAFKQDPVVAPARWYLHTHSLIMCTGGGVKVSVHWIDAHRFSRGHTYELLHAVDGHPLFVPARARYQVTNEHFEESSVIRCLFAVPGCEAEQSVDQFPYDYDMVVAQAVGRRLAFA